MRRNGRCGPPFALEPRSGSLSPRDYCTEYTERGTVVSFPSGTAEARGGDEGTVGPSRVAFSRYMRTMYWTFSVGRRTTGAAGSLAAEIHFASPA